MTVRVHWVSLFFFVLLPICFCFFLFFCVLFFFGGGRGLGFKVQGLGLWVRKDNGGCSLVFLCFLPENRAPEKGQTKNKKSQGQQKQAPLTLRPKGAIHKHPYTHAARSNLQ